MRRILVTGGFGFIGGHLVEALVANPGNMVYVVDNLTTNPVPVNRYLAEINGPDNLVYTISDLHAWLNNPVVHVYKFDQIYHLASPVGPAGVLKHAGEMVRTVVRDTYAVLDYAVQHGSKVVDVSTSEIYGGGKNGECSEAYDRVVPARTTIRLEYAVAKLAAEVALQNMCKVNPALRASIVRPFNVAGPRQSPKGGFVLPRFIRQAIRGEALTVFGDGRQVRAFTHVKDVAAGLMLVMEQAPGNGEAYNLGNPANKIPILELAEIVIAVFGQGEVSFVDPQTIFGPLYAEAAEKYPDAGKIMLELGWEPTRGVVDTVQDALAYEMVNQKVVAG